jgi:hypothetical protein
LEVASHVSISHGVVNLPREFGQSKQWQWEKVGEREKFLPVWHLVVPLIGEVT